MLSLMEVLYLQSVWMKKFSMFTENRSHIFLPFSTKGLKPRSYHLYRRIIKDEKQTHIEFFQNTKTCKSYKLLKIILTTLLLPTDWETTKIMIFKKKTYCKQSWSHICFHIFIIQWYNFHQTLQCCNFNLKSRNSRLINMR